MSAEQQIKEVIESMKELLDDPLVPKNVKTKIENAIKALQEKGDISIKVNKALDEFDELGDDTNMEPFTRSQIWNIVSALEMIH